MTNFKNMLHILEYRTARQPDRIAYRFLGDARRTEPEEITYRELSDRARRLAFLLKENHLKPGDRVLINHLPGIRYIVSFFAALYAGGSAVPIYPPRYSARMDRVSMIINDSGAQISLTSSLVTKSMDTIRQDEALMSILWIEADIDLSKFPPIKDSEVPDLSTDELAFLQYTSGSTSDPKGVMLTHGNLIANLECIHRKFEVNPEIDQGVIWLPPYHDMGFIGGILTPLYSGFPVTLMSPFTFLQRPVRWLEAITQYRGTISGAPNFAYDQCVRRIRDEVLEELDLSSWRVSFCGAEPIQPGMLDRFAKRFAPCGFEKRMFYPCYGLAEATLIATGGRVGQEPVVLSVDRKKIEDEHFASPSTQYDSGNSRACTVVSCGSVVFSNDLKIVDHQTLELCPDGKVGEIWISGTSVAKGYWRLPEETQKVFGASYAGQKDQKKYLRTGDLGFIYNGEIYITGRIKDMLIIRGKNFYPQDIEVSVSNSHEFVKSGVGAAFSITKDGEENLVILSEIERNTRTEDFDIIINAIETSIFEEHGLNATEVHLLKPSSIPFTSSGKVMRQTSRKIFLEKGFEILR